MATISVDHQAKLLAQREKDEAEEARLRWIEKQEALAMFNESDDNNPFDDARRMGTVMATPEFERRLLKLNRNIVFRWGTKSRDHKWLMIRKGNTVEKFCTYPSPTIPERSLFRRNMEVKYDQRYGRPHLPGGVATNRLDHDLANWEWMPADMELCINLNARAGTKFTLKQMQEAWEPNGQGIGRWVCLDRSALPGMKKVTLPFGEFKRGRNTVLLRLVKAGHLMVDQVEREFGGDDTPEWKGHTGKGAVVRPW